MGVGEGEGEGFIAGLQHAPGHNYSVKAVQKCLVKQKTKHVNVETKVEWTKGEHVIG